MSLRWRHVTSNNDDGDDGDDNDDDDYYYDDLFSIRLTVLILFNFLDILHHFKPTTCFRNSHNDGGNTMVHSDLFL